MLTFWKDDLQKHFQSEEKILIPTISGVDEQLDLFTCRVLREHKLIEKILRELEQNVNIEYTLDRFGNALDEHIRFEEREWFEKIQETFNTDQLNKIEEKFKSASF